MALEKAEHPSPIQISDEGDNRDTRVLSGPETFDSVATGAQNSKSSVFSLPITRASATCPVPPASLDCSVPSTSISGIHLLAGVGSNGGGGGRTSSASVRGQSASPSAGAREQRQQQQRIPAAKIDPTAKIENTLCGSPSDTRKQEKPEAAVNDIGKEVAVGSSGLEGAQSGTEPKAGRRARAAARLGAVKGGDDASGSGANKAQRKLELELEFRSRLRHELVFMLEQNGGRCMMSEANAMYRRTFGHDINLQGHNLRTLLERRGGMPGVRVQRLPSETWPYKASIREIRLISPSAAGEDESLRTVSEHDSNALRPCSTSRSDNARLTPTVVSRDALQMRESASRAKMPQEESSDSPEQGIKGRTDSLVDSLGSGSPLTNTWKPPGVANQAANPLYMPAVSSTSRRPGGRTSIGRGRSASGEYSASASVCQSPDDRCTFTSRDGGFLRTAMRSPQQRSPLRRSPHGSSERDRRQRSCYKNEANDGRYGDVGRCSATGRDAPHPAVTTVGERHGEGKYDGAVAGARGDTHLASYRARVSYGGSASPPGIEGASAEDHPTQADSSPRPHSGEHEAFMRHSDHRIGTRNAALSEAGNGAHGHGLSSGDSGRIGGGGGRGSFARGVPLAPGGGHPPPPAARPKKRRLMHHEANDQPCRPHAEELFDNDYGASAGAPICLTKNDPPKKRYAAAAPAGHMDGYPASDGGLFGRRWAGKCNGGSQGSGGAGVHAEVPAPATWRPPASVRPFPVLADCTQGVQVMIKGTHRAVPEQRIRALASDFGVVGKIEVLESLEEASRAVVGLNGHVVPHVSKRPMDSLTASIWSEDKYQALMAKDNMRRYADSMRKASTWYEQHTNGGLHGPAGDSATCRFFALGRGCIFGRNCAFRHEGDHHHHDSGQAANIRTRFAGNDDPALPAVSSSRSHRFGGPGPALAAAGVAASEHVCGQQIISLVAHHKQSPAPTSVHGDELDRRPGAVARGSHAIDRDLMGDVHCGGGGVEVPWQPEQRPGHYMPRCGFGNGRGGGLMVTSGDVLEPRNNSRLHLDGPREGYVIDIGGSDASRSRYDFKYGNVGVEDRGGIIGTRGVQRDDSGEAGRGTREPPRGVVHRKRCRHDCLSHVNERGCDGRARRDYVDEGGFGKLSAASRHEERRHVTTRSRSYGREKRRSEARDFCRHDLGDGRHRASRSSSRRRHARDRERHISYDRGGHHDDRVRHGDPARDGSNRGGTAHWYESDSERDDDADWRRRKRKRNTGRGSDRGRGGDRGGRDAGDSEEVHGCYDESGRHHDRLRDVSGRRGRAHRYDSDGTRDDGAGWRKRKERRSNKRGSDRDRRDDDSEAKRLSFSGKRTGNRREEEDDDDGGGWVLRGGHRAGDRGASSRNGDRRMSVGCSSEDGGAPPISDRRFEDADDIRTDHVDCDGELMDEISSHAGRRTRSKPVKTTFTVTAHLGALQPPRVARAAPPATSFSVTMPTDLKLALKRKASRGA